MRSDRRQKIRILALAGLVMSTLGCVPTSGDEFTTNGQPTSTSAEKLALITGVSDGSIVSIFFVPKPKQYAIIYVPKRISPAKLSAAEQRMCRFRKLTYDRAGEDEPLEITHENVPPPTPNPYEGAHTRTFFCR